MIGAGVSNACPIFYVWIPFHGSGFHFLGALLCGTSAAQSRAKPASAPSSTAQQGLKLANDGHCPQAIPVLKKAATQPGDKDLKRQVGFNGVRCAMSENQPDAAVDFLRFLNREFPHDPDVLYVSVHTYSDLSTSAAQELAATAPNSYQARRLNAEALELQGKWDQAAGRIQAHPATEPAHARDPFPAGPPLAFQA